ncbi:head GIN domain-containing protein [uncultured Flavobacterium sp.]|uniref:head GIN domain-containing protein n=1 Tax=uncultured Flavobacterium sp. TaxID=165435 RepID=UPI0025DFC465|nr:head GIN domain-containing protein [uncultured Flavobacterium sp.]
MIKVIVHVTKAIIAVIASLLFFSCNLDFKKVDGDGNVVTKERKMSGDFTKIDAGTGLEVIIEQGSGQMVTVEADNNLHQHIKTEVKDGELEIKADVNIGNATAKKVIVRLPNIEGIESGSGCAVSTRNTLKADSILLSSGSGSTMTVAIEAKNATLESGSGSTLKVTGKAGDITTDSGSGGTINARGLVAKKAVSEASSGSTTVINATESLTADASSGGIINYVSTPSNLSKKTSSGGSVGQE